MPNDDSRDCCQEGVMRTLIISIILLTSAAIISACEFTYTLTDSQDRSREISVDSPVMVTRGESYTLSLSYWEDHRSCKLGPEGTMFLLDGARWRVQRDTQPLILLSDVSWDGSSSRTKTGTVRFTANTAGSWILEVLRICDREGYQGELVFLVSQGENP